MKDSCFKPNEDNLKQFPWCLILCHYIVWYCNCMGPLLGMPVLSSLCERAPSNPPGQIAYLLRILWSWIISMKRNWSSVCGKRWCFFFYYSVRCFSLGRWQETAVICNLPSALLARRLLCIVVNSNNVWCWKAFKYMREFLKLAKQSVYLKIKSLEKYSWIT